MRVLMLDGSGVREAEECYGARLIEQGRAVPAPAPAPAPEKPAAPKRKPAVEKEPFASLGKEGKEDGAKGQDSE